VTELWLIRHGQTDWNVAGRYQGQTDIPLNATGLQQARELAAHLSGQKFEAVYSSDLSRASQTAEVLASMFDLSVNLQPGLREIDQGEWEGQTIAEIRERYAERVAERKANPLDSRPPGGESTREVAERVAAVADAIHRAHPAGPVILVSHGFSVATLICQAGGFPLSEVYQHIPENAQPKIIHWGQSEGQHPWSGNNSREYSK
jgi:2,3-bisphosphoglycerate-dependent phosphoglycerate mutase